MYFLTDPLVQLSLQHFDQLVNPGIEEGDWYFETFGPGNGVYATDRPFERFHDYEDLLILLQDRDSTKYDKIHKGTPFFFLAWLAFDLRNYEKTLYYCDAAISEDVRNRGDQWINFPGAGFLKLSTAQHVAGRVIEKIRSLLLAQIDRFNSISNLPPINVDLFIDKFVNHLMQDPSTRTIISALYIFLLEADERLIELRIKSTQGSSPGPVIAHLFGGGLLFESLLKLVYPKKDDGSPTENLGQVFHTSAFKSDFGTGVKTRSDCLQKIIGSIQDDTYITAFSTASKLRNTTGHNLIWDNVFQSTVNYELLLNKIFDSVFFLIERRFIR